MLQRTTPGLFSITFLQYNIILGSEDDSGHTARINRPDEFCSPKLMYPKIPTAFRYFGAQTIEK
jgi:hypothetical protein